MKLLLISALSLALSGCAARKPAAAHLVIPVECIDEVRATRPIDLNRDGASAKRASIAVRYHCTRIKKDR